MPSLLAAASSKDSSAERIQLWALALRAADSIVQAALHGAAPATDSLVAPLQVLVVRWLQHIFRSDVT